jgi:glycosyltransferase involved in cell wall biosynthesis
VSPASGAAGVDPDGRGPARPLVSVIIPFFNPGAYLAEAVASVLAQDYRPLEVVLVDDGSTEAHADAGARLAETSAPVRLLRLPSNQGPAAARNAGIGQARGALLTFLDADDLMVPDRLACQVGYLEAHPGTYVVVGLAENVLEPGVAPPAWLVRTGTGVRHGYPYATTMLGPRRVFERVGAFDPAFRVGEDTDWMLRARAAGVVVKRLDRVLIRRRLHGANLTYRTEEVQAAVHRVVLRLARERLARRRRAHTLRASGAAPQSASTQLASHAPPMQPPAQPETTTGLQRAL